jgi:Tfp pilus assembly protein PilF
MFAICVSLFLLVCAGFIWPAVRHRLTGDHTSISMLMPRDSAVARDYVTARDKWARRTPSDLKEAIRLYEEVVRRDPDFAPAHAGLAEAWLILREYGGADDPFAYRQGRRYAEAALRLNRNLPSAHRALGFIDYWWDGKASTAVSRLERAIALDERDAQTHFWYANMLADMGRDQDAQREYDRARLLSPGSRVIEVEQACSHWQAGRNRLALQQLTVLAAQAPGDATVQNCLAWIYISQGDLVGFIRALDARAKLRGEPQLLRLAADLNNAIRRGRRAALNVLIAGGRRELATGARRIRETPAFYASAMGERRELIRLMTEAVDVGERWPSVPVTRRIAAHWPNDKEVQGLLRRLRPPASQTPAR